MFRKILDGLLAIIAIALVAASLGDSATRRGFTAGMAFASIAVVLTTRYASKRESDRR